MSNGHEMPYEPRVAQSLNPATANLLNGLMVPKEVVNDYEAGNLEKVRKLDARFLTNELEILEVYANSYFSPYITRYNIPYSRCVGYIAKGGLSVLVELNKETGLPIFLEQGETVRSRAEDLGIVQKEADWES